jgi:DNA-binding GntR family transcriptional regulator
LDEIIKKQKRCNENKDYFNFAHLDADFHQYLIEKEENGLFIQTMSNIRERTFFNSASFLKKRQCMPGFIKEHEEIMVALKQGNCELAVKELEEHIRNGKIELV